MRGCKAKVAIILASVLLAPAVCGASCLEQIPAGMSAEHFDPFRRDLASADVVYVGTVVGSRLARPLSELQAGNYRDQPDARLEVEAQIVLKGTPSSITDIRAGTEYADPRRGKFVHFSETIEFAPGDSVLIVGNAGEPVFVGFCAPSREWDAETRKAVRALFPMVP